MKKGTLYLFLGLASLHLVLSVIGASHLSLARLGRLGGILDYYGELSGARSGYGFFAPGIGIDLRARFDVIDAQGQRTGVRIESGASHEADLRIAGAITQLKEDFADPQKFQRALTASLAGKILVRYPQAKAVVVCLERFDPVSMAAFRKGARPRWKTFYVAKFVTESRSRNHGCP